MSESRGVDWWWVVERMLQREARGCSLAIMHAVFSNIYVHKNQTYLKGIMLNVSHISDDYHYIS